MASTLELLPELAVVVDLTVLHDMDGSVLVGDRLVAACEIDDRQPSRGKADDGVDEHTAAVGAAMHEGLVHRFEHVLVDALVPRHHAADSTHGFPV